MPTPLAKARVQGAAEHPIGMGSRSTIAWIFKVHVGWDFFVVVFLNNFMVQPPSMEKIRSRVYPLVFLKPRKNNVKWLPREGGLSK